MMPAARDPAVLRELYRLSLVVRRAEGRIRDL